MMERKFTDDEKILSLLKVSDDVYANAKLTPEEAKTLLDLINRQKAEVERLQSVVVQMHNTTPELIRQVKAEAIKEFAERWKKYWKAQMDVSTNQHQDEIVLRDIDNLVKEMTGEDNGN